MTKHYRTINSRRALLSMLLVAVLGLVSMNSWAQDQTIAWTGATDTDASNPTNWDPQVSPLENTLEIDSAHKYTNLPILSLTGDNAIRAINVMQTGIFTIADAGNFLDINQEGSNYLGGGILIEAGNVSYRKNLYLEDTMSVITLTGGSLETRSYLLMGKDNSSEHGGLINLSGDAKLHARVAPGRFSTDSLKSVITITENAYMEVRGDWVETAQGLIDRNQITSDDNFDPFVVYDPDNALTVIDLRSKDELFLINKGTVQVLVDQEIPPIQAAHNRGFDNLVSKEWKYATVSGGPYTSFATPQTGDSLYQASLSDAGTYFVILEGNTGSEIITSDEVQVAVTSPMVTLTPAGSQTIRMGYTAGQITASFMETPTSYEWKYTTTSGSGYVSFDPAVNVAEFTPNFTEEGVYYVVVEATVNGETHFSPEVMIKMIARNSAGVTIDWTGAYSTDAADIRNYEPMMHPWFNTVNVSKDFVLTPPVLSTTGNDTIAFLALADSAEFIINKAASDSVYFTGDGYQNGKIIIEGGVIVNKYYGRLDGNNSGYIFKNSSKFYAGDVGLIMGQKNGPNGGILNVQDDAVIRIDREYTADWGYDGGAFWRFATDTTHSIITVSENGKLELLGDHLAIVASYIAKNQLRAKEGFVIDSELKDIDGVQYTIVTAKSEVAFDISPLDAQYTGVNMAGDELSTINDDVITSREWKYTTTSGESYMSFDPAETGATLNPTFAAAGMYYVICEGSDGTDTYVSDEAVVNVVSVEVAPADAQTIEVFTEGNLLTVTESMTPDSREWKHSATSGSAYTSFSPARLSDTYSPLFSAAGTVYVICESVFNGKAIPSNEVEIVVSEEASDDATLSALTSDLGSLDPAFSSSTTTYALAVPEGTTSVSLTATATDDNATVTGDGAIDVSSGSATATIVVTAEDGSTTKTYTVNITVTVGIELNTLYVNIYPNPSTGSLFIEMDGDSFSVEAFDMTGKSVLREEFTSPMGAQEIRLENKGIYMLKIMQGDAITLRKVVINN